MAEQNRIMALSPGHLLNEERVLRIPLRYNSKNLGNRPRIKIYDKILRIATWNVRSLFMPGKLTNAEKEMERMNIDILGLSEVRWPGSGKQRTQKGYIYYSGGSNNEHRHGTAVILTDKIAESVVDFVPVNERIIFIKMKTTHRDLNVIQIYAPTNDKTEQEIEEFYNKIDEVISLTKKGEITMVIGDFNAKIGAGVEGDNIGAYGLGIRNARGDRLNQFCTENNFLIANTFFKQHPRRLYTWKAPTDNKQRLVRNQIDFILLNMEFKKYIHSVKTYLGADINSDHNPVVMDFKIKRFKRIKRETLAKHIDIDKLKNPEVKEKISYKIEKELKTIEARIQTEEEIQTTWNAIKNKITDVQEQDIGFRKNNKKQEWMTQEILDLMSERRRNKTRPSQYKNINKIIRKKCREAKEKLMSEKCQEIELLQEKYDTFNIHKNVKEMTGRTRKHQTTTLRDSNNEIILGIEGKLRRWKEYVEELFDDDRPNKPPPEDQVTNEKAPEISKSEVIHAIKILKNRKATGPDKIHAEILKIIADNESKGLDLITLLFNKIYVTGRIPTDWLKSTFITIPKKTNSSQCDDYRMISIMSHVLKTFLRVIHTRIYKKCEYQINNTQFGFRNGFGTREALFALNVLTQRCKDMNVSVYACFIDYRKAFDCVNHQKMLQILRLTGIDEEDLRIITELYWHQTSKVKVEQENTDDILIKKGVRQGCVLSPLLFNLYSEAIFKEALEEDVGGIKINGTTINNIRYADDTLIMANNLIELQHMMDNVVQHSERFGLQLNVSKTKVIVFAKTHVAANLYINGEIVEQVAAFKYLGTNINSQSESKKEILSRIEQARRTFMNMKTFFTRSDLSLELRIRMTRSYIFPILLYGCESWTLDPNTEKRLNAFEMYLYRRMLRVSWTQRVTNDEILIRMNKQRELMNTIKVRKTQYIGHVMRGERYELLRIIIEGKIKGRRSVGRRQNSWLKDLRRWYGCSSAEIFRAAVSKATIAIWIANLRQERAT